MGQYLKNRQYKLKKEAQGVCKLSTSPGIGEPSRLSWKAVSGVGQVIQAVIATSKPEGGEDPLAHTEHRQLCAYTPVPGSAITPVRSRCILTSGTVEFDRWRMRRRDPPAASRSSILVLLCITLDIKR